MTYRDQGLCLVLPWSQWTNHMDTQFHVSPWPSGRLPASWPVLEGLPLQPQGSPLSELRALKSRVKSRGLGRSLSSWQLCLRIILSKLICEVYIGHGRDCQTKLFMAWMFTRVLPLEHNLQPFILKVWCTRILSSNDRKPCATQSEKNVKLFLVAWQEQLPKSTAQKKCAYSIAKPQSFLNFQPSYRDERACVSATTTKWPIANLVKAYFEDCSHNACWP